MVTLAQVADALERRVEDLQELDRRPVRLAFVGGSYETVVVRDRASRSTVEATLDTTNGERVDANDLRRRDRELADRVGAALEPQLRDLVLRHPELRALRVLVTRSGQARAIPLRLAAREVAALAQEPGVTHVALAEDPEIAD